MRRRENNAGSSGIGGRDGAGLLPPLDLGALEDYCRLSALNRELHQDIDRRGVHLKPLKVGAGLKQNPSVKLAVGTHGQLQRLRETLGLTGLSRPRLAEYVRADRPADGLQAFLDGETDELEGPNGEKLN